MNIVRRSIPIPSPDVGGIPYSSARTKSMSMNIASSSPLSFSFTCNVNACVLLDRLEDRAAAERRLEVNLLVSDCNLCLAVKLEGDLLEKLFHELHHPDVALVNHIDLHTFFSLKKSAS